MVEVSPQTGLVFPHHYFYEFPKYPLAGGYATLDDYFGGWGGYGAGRPFLGGLLGTFDTRLAMVVGGEMLVIPRARCLVSSLKMIPLSWRRSQLTSGVYPSR